MSAPLIILLIYCSSRFDYITRKKECARHRLCVRLVLAKYCTSQFHAMKRIVTFAAIVASASALSASVSIKPQTTSLFQDLKLNPVTRASDQASVVLPSLWRSNTPFGVADEVAVCAFLRHFG